jgi:N-sulfoglucosamine sulfohydrolase
MSVRPNETDTMLSGESSRRTFLQGAAGVAAAASLPAGVAAAAAPAPFRPNIIYLHSHDSGRYLMPYGQDVPTPNIKKLADGGVMFRQAFSAAPTCSPSRASLLTGQWAHVNGMLGLAHRGFTLHDYKHVIVHPLHDAGYHTVLAGLQHIAPKDHVDWIGYDTLIPHKGERVADVMPGALAFLANPGTQPFFLDCGFFETHRTYPTPTADDHPDHTQPPTTVPDCPETRYDMACFHASARNLDYGVGELMDALEKHGLAENTLVINTTDHGISFPRAKCSLTDQGFGVHLVMRGPREFSKPMICNAMVSHIDVFPTVCEYLGIEKPSWFQGKSFLPVLRGEVKEINDQVFAEVTYHAAYEPKRAVRTHRYIYSKRFDGRTKPVLPNTDDGPSKTVWIDAGWRDMNIETEETLYDLIFDPNEENNLIGNKDYVAQLTEMRGRLDQWMKSTDDPILKGPIGLPPGAITTNPNLTSPGEGNPNKMKKAAEGEAT